MGIPLDRKETNMADKPLERHELDELYLLRNSAKEEGIDLNPANEDEELENEDQLLDENGEPIVEDDTESEDSENEEVVLSDKELDKLLKTSNEKLKEMGIDNPDAYKSMQKLLNKKQNEWKQKEAEYLNKLQSTIPSDKITQLEKEIAELKTPPKKEEILKPPDPPKMPRRPVDFKWEDVGVSGTPSQIYMEQKDQFDLDTYEFIAKTNEYNNRKNEQLQRRLEDEQRARAQREQMESIKSQTLADLMKEGLSAAEAHKAFEELTTDPTFVNAKVVVYGYRQKHGIKPNNKNKSKTKRFDDMRNKRNFAAPPGLSGAGTGKVYPNEFSKGTDFSKMYETKKA
jgi:hypothetical protein